MMVGANPGLLALCESRTAADHDLMTKHISVGFDGTPSSSEAVSWAAGEAAMMGASLRIVTCFDIPVDGSGYGYGYGYGDAISFLEKAARRSSLAEETAIRRSHPNLSVTSVIAPGPPLPVLLEGLDHDDLVVVGTSAHGAMAAFWLGSTPRSLVRRSPCPVVIVRGRATEGRPNRVVVGVDGSDASNVALSWAEDEANRCHAELVIVHGWNDPYAPLHAGNSPARDLIRVDATRVLDQAETHAAGHTSSHVTGLLVEASPATALLGTLKDGDLLVVGSRGRGALASTVFGSTVNGVLEQCAVPVVVVHPSKNHDTS